MKVYPPIAPYGLIGDVNPDAQSVLAPASHGAQLIADLSWLLIAGSAAIFVLVIILTVIAVTGTPRPASTRTWIAGFGLAFPILVLSAVLLHTVSVGAGLSSHEESALGMRVEVTGHRWWWEMRYPAADGAPTVVMANELHLPAGEMVDLRLRTHDVIHSFWIPALAGKVDMIPGKENRLLIEAREPGVYRGQCAEYCGAQHARMAFEVVDPGLCAD